MSIVAEPLTHSLAGLGSKRSFITSHNPSSIRYSAALLGTRLRNFSDCSNSSHTHDSTWFDPRREELRQGRELQR